MNPPPRPDPRLPHPAIHHRAWLNPQRHYQATHTNPESQHVPTTPDHPQDLTGCEMALVILGGVLIFAGFVLPYLIPAGILCLLLAHLLSGHRKM